jgi:homoserine kinase
VTPRDSITLEVPASTSNLGPGFDCLGLALRLALRVKLTRQPGAAIAADRATAEPARAMVEEAAERFFAVTGGRRKGFRFDVTSEVPVARGLGSSGALRIGVLAALDALGGVGLTRLEIAALGTALEGHPDNACAATFGGFTIGRTSPDDGRLLDVQRFPVSEDVVFVVASPDLAMGTKESRGLLPGTVAFADAARNVNSTAAIVAAFATQDYARLQGAVTDFLHERHRVPRIPGAREAIDAGVAAGAHAGFLSGSGSSVVCVGSRAHGAAVARAMAVALAASGVPGQVRELLADNAGFRIAGA